MNTLTNLYPTLEGFDPLSIEFLRNPRPIVRKAQAESPVFYYEPLDMWVITKHADICQAARDYETFSSQALSFVPPPADLVSKVPEHADKELFIVIDPPIHTDDRKAVASFFTPRAIEKHEQEIRDIANRLIDGFIEKGKCEFMYDFAYPFSLEVILRVIGIPTDRMNDYREWTNHLFSVFSPKKKQKPMSEEESREHWEALIECFNYFDDLVEQRLENPTDDIISKILKQRDENGELLMSKSRLSRHILEFIAAGNDTAPNLMAAMLQFLEEFPVQKEILFSDLSQYMPNAIEETLRIRGTSPGLFRITTRDVELSGVTIPKGEVVWLLFAAGGLDDDKFENPEIFDIQRHNAKEHLAFGFARHMCLGNPLARLEMKIGMEELLKRIPDIQIDRTEDLNYYPVLTVLILEKMNVFWSPKSLEK